jgi:hypothetical protein
MWATLLPVLSGASANAPSTTPAAYTAFRCSRVLQREDTGGVRAILGPVIESGIAVQAGLIQHLQDHGQVLKQAISAQPGPRQPDIECRPRRLRLV